MCLHGVDPQLGQRWAVGRAEERGRYQSEPYVPLLTPTRPLLTEDESDPTSSSGSSASVSL